MSTKYCASVINRLSVLCVVMVNITSGDEDDGFPPTDVMPLACDVVNPLDPFAEVERGITVQELDMDEESFWRLFQ